MVGTFQALAVLLLAVLPGAVYTWAFERIAGRWGIAASDRLFRFLGISALFHALVAPGSYRIWVDYLRPAKFDEAQALPLWLWGVALAYVLVPGAIGTAIGVAFRSGKGWAKVLVGPVPAPTAWDAVFSGSPGGYILLKLKSGEWLGGEYGTGSYVGGYPEPADIYLAKELWIDPDMGDFLRDEDGNPVATGFGVLVRWDEVEYLEITD